MLHKTIVIADDHRLFSNALSELISKSGRYKVLYEVDNGKQLVDHFRSSINIPDIVLLDINMPVMDGIETAAWIKKNHPDVLVLALSMNNDESNIVQMIRNGAKGYLLKDTNADELNKALDAITSQGFYHSEIVTQHLINNISNPSGNKAGDNFLNEREKEFLKLVCSELTYKEIADKMFLSPRTIDGYREALFEKLNVKSRIGLVLYSIESKLVKI